MVFPAVKMFSALIDLIYQSPAPGTMPKPSKLVNYLRIFHMTDLSPNNIHKSSLLQYYNVVEFEVDTTQEILLF